MHARMSRMLKDIDERLARCADAIESDPCSRAGQWAAVWYPSDLGQCREVRLDLGCGRGGFTIEAARREPDVLYVGLDNEVLVIACAARNALEAGVRNVVFATADSSIIRGVFAPGEVARLYLNFSTPFPRKKEAKGRLTYVDNLVAYYDILAPGAALCLKTDSQPFRDFTLTQLELAGYEVLWSTDDLRAVAPAVEARGMRYVDHGGRRVGSDESAATDRAANGAGEPADIDASLVPPEMLITSEYEARLVAEGAKVLALQAVPGRRPDTWEQTAPISLVDYLPEDLESIGYVPYGMGDAVVNLRNRRRKAAQKQVQHGKPRNPGPAENAAPAQSE